MPIPDSINRVFREFKRYTGDGLPNEPAAAPLPTGDPTSGVNSPKKAEIRVALGDVIDAADDAADRAEEALADALAMIVPNNSVSTAKIVNEAVTTAKLADDAVTPAKLSDAPSDIAAFKAMFGITGATAIGRAINGLVLANNATTPNTKIDISPGSARDKDQTVDIVLATGWVKTVSVWAAGNGNGGLDAGSIAINTGYHVHLIYNPTTADVDALISTSATAPVMPTGFTKRRRIGGFTTDASGFIRSGLWRADGSFRFAANINTLAGVSGLNLTLHPLPVPLGVKLKVRCFALVSNNAGSNAAISLIIRDPDVGAPVDDANLLFEGLFQKALGDVNGGVWFEEWTDATGQIYYWTYPKASANLVYLYLHGWTDLRDEFS